MKGEWRVKTEADILSIIRQDRWMMGTLEAASSLQMPDWWICAGFVRTKIWDVLHGYAHPTPLSDIDFIYFDGEHAEESREKEIERQLKQLLPGRPWSVKNEARMHVVNGLAPYVSAGDAVSKFPETATAVAVKLDEQGELQLVAPWGIDDLIRMKVRPTPSFAESKELMSIYESRMKRKKWKERWPLVERIDRENT
ncbi:nucleotidyltransferase family protein [Pradoshia sp.]